MWPTRDNERRRLVAALKHHHRHVQAMPGISDPRALGTFALQIVASLRREDYYRAVQRKPVNAKRADPNDPSFDAERAVAYHVQNGNFDEACWLVFLMAHFARPADTGWMRLCDVYGKLGKGMWDWPTVSQHPRAFKTWLDANWQNIRGKFGNHRKYASIRPSAERTTTDVVASYLSWIGTGGHSRRFAAIIRQAGNDPHVIFDAFYQQFDVISFGRLGKFDYLALLGRYKLAPIAAGSAYLEGSTGPLSGARLLLENPGSKPLSKLVLQARLDELHVDLKVGMEVLEDALCNWQKSQFTFVHYMG